MKLAVPNADFTPGSRITYNDRRPGHTDVAATVLETDARSMIVQFDDRADTTHIQFSDPQWMEHIAFVT